MLPSRLSISRHGIFYFRIAVPSSLHAACGVKEIRRSLCTRDPKEAKSLAYALSFAHLKAFGKMNSSDDLKKRFSEVAENLEAIGAVGKIRIELPSGVAVECDSKEELEAVKDLFGGLSFPQAVEKIMSSPVGPRFSEISKELFIDSSSRWVPRTLKEYQVKSKVFADFVNDKPIQSITRDDVTAFKRELQKTSVGKTINKYLAVVHLVFQHALKNGKYQGALPSDSQSVSERKARVVKSHFLPNHLEAIFGYFKNSKDDLTLYYFCVLGLCTGMRVGEIGQLRCVDFIQSVIDGQSVLCISINDLHPDKTLKTNESKRVIPVPAHVFKSGFVDFVESIRENDPNSRVFQELGFTEQGYGKDVSKRFSRLLIRLGIKESSLSFHSFRHTFNYLMTAAGVDESVRCAWLGHKYDSVNVSSYNGKPTLAILSTKCLPVIDSWEI